MSKAIRKRGARRICRAYQSSSGTARCSAICGWRASSAWEIRWSIKGRRAALPRVARDDRAAPGDAGNPFAIGSAVFRIFGSKLGMAAKKIPEITNVHDARMPLKWIVGYVCQICDGHPPPICPYDAFSGTECKCEGPCDVKVKYVLCTTHC